MNCKLHNYLVEYQFGNPNGPLLLRLCRNTIFRYVMLVPEAAKRVCELTLSIVTQPRFKEADIDNGGELDISDLVLMVEFQFKQGKPPLSCQK